jgi:hypothetical protein
MEIEDSVFLDIFQKIKNDTTSYANPHEKCMAWSHKMPELFLKIPHVFKTAADPEADIQFIKNLLEIRRSMMTGKTNEDDSNKMTYEMLNKHYNTYEIVEKENEKKKKKENKENRRKK